MNRKVDEENGKQLVKGNVRYRTFCLYLNKKESLVKGNYLVEVVGHDKKKVL